MNRTRLALGLAGGYLLGRYRKTRVLAAIMAVVVAKRLGDAVVERGTEALGSPPELERLAGAGREAAVAVLSRQVSGLSQRIHDRTESLRQSLQPGNGGQQHTGNGKQQPDQPNNGQPEQSGSADQQQEQSGSADDQQQRAGGNGAPARSGNEDGDRDPAQREPQGGQSRRTQVSGRPSTTPGRG